MHETKTGLKRQKDDFEFQEVDSTILQSYVGKYVIKGDIAEVYMTSAGNLINQLSRWKYGFRSLK
jgi:hypothetical protein